MKILNILFRVIVLGLVGIWAILTYPSFTPLREISVIVIKFILGLFSIESTYYSNYLITEIGGINRIFTISPECAGIYIFIIFLVGCFLFPKARLKDLIISILFIPLIFLLNIIRILISILLAKYLNIELSIFFHNTFGQVFIFVIGIFIYVVWLRIALKSKSLKGERTYE